jgi:hypothetical protein
MMSPANKRNASISSQAQAMNNCKIQTFVESTIRKRSGITFIHDWLRGPSFHPTSRKASFQQLFRLWGIVILGNLVSAFACGVLQFWATEIVQARDGLLVIFGFALTGAAGYLILTAWTKSCPIAGDGDQLLNNRPPAVERNFFNSDFVSKRTVKARTVKGQAIPSSARNRLYFWPYIVFAIIAGILFGLHLQLVT